MKENFLGIELGGSRSHRTSLVALDYFPEEKKIFIAENAAHLQAAKGVNADDFLVAKVRERPYTTVAIHAPLSLPPCIPCTLECPGVANCVVPAVKWMREEAGDPLPYVQRPIDIFLKKRWKLDWQDSLGASYAPMAARMQYLKRHFEADHFLEAQPRAALFGIAAWFKIQPRELRRYRSVDSGVEIRAAILERLGGKSRVAGVPELFLYQADALELARDLAAFDALLCALMAVYEREGLLETLPFGQGWGSVAVPKKIGSIPGSEDPAFTEGEA